MLAVVLVYAYAIVTFAIALYFELPINTPELRIPFGDALAESGVTR
jgi:hypothetical protein